jgi:hypothetical protein
MTGAHLLPAKTIRIGRTPDNDITLADLARSLRTSSQPRSSSRALLSCRTALSSEGVAFHSGPAAKGDVTVNPVMGPLVILFLWLGVTVVAAIAGIISGSFSAH